MIITDKYVFFWDGIYSNWYISRFNIDGMNFSSAEQYMMYRKAITFNDMLTAEEIMNTPSPSQQKKLGRSVKGFDGEYWDKVCISEVFKGCYAKFKQNSQLKENILKDGYCRTFVEASPYDTIWGIGMYENDINIENFKSWQGKNYLGIVLNCVYQALRVNEEGVRL